VRGIEVQVEGNASGLLELRYSLEGDIGRIRLPAIRESCRADGLWQHTCFEIFLKPNESAAYREFNFAPSTEWAAYAFSAYREGMVPAEEGWSPRIAVRRSDYRLELQTTVNAALPMRVALAAVTEDENGTLSYWALQHPGDKPDFHHSDSFTLEL
jgi:hypothetical protein